MTTPQTAGRDHFGSLAGKTILYTGAAGGLGHDTTLHMLASGARVVAVDIDETKIAALEALNEVSSELSNEVKEAELDAKLESLAGESELDDALAELKAKMGQGDQKVLPAGSEPKED